MTSLSRTGRCEHCRREFEAELEVRVSFRRDSEATTYDGIGYWYKLGALRIWIELDASDKLHIVCPSCLRWAASEAEHVSSLVEQGVEVL